MKRTLVGLAGRARSGKDTTAQVMLDLGVASYRYAFADPIRAMLKAGTGIDMNDPYWIARKEVVLPDLGKSPRQMMQALGTEWGRNCVHPDLWLTLAGRTLARRGPGMVVSDVRFENEAAWVRRQGGVVLHILRGDAPAVHAHASEAGIRIYPPDLVLDNNSTLAELHRRIARLFGAPRAHPPCRSSMPSSLEPASS